MPRNALIPDPRHPAHPRPRAHAPVTVRPCAVRPAPFLPCAALPGAALPLRLTLRAAARPLGPRPDERHHAVRPLPSRRAAHRASASGQISNPCSFSRHHHDPWPPSPALPPLRGKGGEPLHQEWSSCRGARWTIRFALHRSFFMHVDHFSARGSPPFPRSGGRAGDGGHGSRLHLKDDHTSKTRPRLNPSKEIAEKAQHAIVVGAGDEHVRLSPFRPTHTAFAEDVWTERTASSQTGRATRDEGRTHGTRPQELRRATQ